MKKRGSIYRKYVTLVVALVGGALIVSGIASMYRSYIETRSALIAVEREQAVSASIRIENFVKDIERQIGWTSLPQVVATTDPLQARRYEYLKLLQQVPAVTEATYIDANGREQVRVSRIAMNVVGSGDDLSDDPRFKSVNQGQPYFGPVYFRQETEPYMAIAVCAGRIALCAGRRPGGVTAVQVNLKFIWEVVQRIRVGKTGFAYVVDRQGRLVAHPDISLVLQKTDLSRLPQVAAALAHKADGDAQPPRVSEARDRKGRPVLTAFASIESLGWAVFVEQSIEEAYAPLYASLLRTGGLLVIGLLLSMLAGIVFARRMVNPIRALQEGADALGAGDLTRRIEVRTGDELEALGERFNEMAGRLAASYAGLERKVEARTQELQQALAFQSASGEILSSISGSISDTQPVFDAIVRNLRRLFATGFVVVQLLRNGQVEIGAIFGDEGFEGLAQRYPRPLDDTTVGGLVMTSGKALQLTPVLDNPAAPAATVEFARDFGFNSLIAAPMIRETKVIGAIVTAHRDAVPFDEKQVALIKTFADQAVIAIENARLFNETKDALERQTGTSEVLRAISRSPTDTAPVFDAILNRVVALCDAGVASLLLYDGDVLRPVAGVNVVPELYEKLRTTELRPANWNPTLLAALERRTVHVTDILDFPEFRPLTGGAMTREDPWRTVLAVPLLREGALAGVITAWRKEVRAFSEKQIELVSTFADQAVIAIENVRLFDETTEALEQQTATAEILRAISASPSDVKPIFETILDRATRLCDSPLSAVFRYDNGVVDLLSHRNWSPSAFEEMKKYYPGPPNPKMISGRAILSGVLQNEEDASSDSKYDHGAAVAGGWRRMLGVPIKRGGTVLGAFVVGWPTPGRTPERQLRLLETFADQAAIAIENVRLFNETNEALEHQKASAEVLEVISGSVANTEPVFDKILASCNRLFQGNDVGINIVGEDGALHLAAYAGPEKAKLERHFPVPLSAESGSGLAILERKVLHFPDTQADSVPGYARRGSAITGSKSQLFAPMLWEGRGIGAIHVGRGFVGKFSDKEIALLRTFADQAVIAIQNARLFHEIEDKSHQLEIANKHKSDFLANMSHELRTPLNAIIGFSEVLLEKMFGEVNEKQLDYLNDIHSSGKHLLSLINDILDLSKIEAGRMELDLVDVSLPDALATAMTLVRERAQNHGIALSLEVDPKVGGIRADERKVKQVMLNLLSNAVKFTPDGGKIAVRAMLDTDHVEVAVEDTGVGIAPEDQEVVFEEFKQVGRDYTKKAEGTGLGLALTRRIVELHGGKIWLESTPGKGSTFTFTLPLMQQEETP